MTLFLTNLNAYGLTIVSPALLLSLSYRTLGSVIKLLGLSLVVQLLLLIVTEGLLSFFSPVFPRSPLRLVLEILLYGVLSPLVTFCYCYFTLYNPRLSKLLNVRTAASAAMANELEQKKLETEENKRGGMLGLLKSSFRRWHLIVSRRLTLGNTGGLIAVVVPWFYAHFILCYWPTWYDSMRSFGDSAGVWTGMYEQFFYFLASLAIGGHIHDNLTAVNAAPTTIKTGGSSISSSSTITGSKKDQKEQEKHSLSKSLPPWAQLANLSLFILLCTTGVVFFCENMVSDSFGISVPLICSLLWSVS